MIPNLVPPSSLDDEKAVSDFLHVLQADGAVPLAFPETSNHQVATVTPSERQNTSHATAPVVTKKKPSSSDREIAKNNTVNKKLKKATAPEELVQISLDDLSQGS